MNMDRDNYHVNKPALDDDLQKEIDEALGGQTIEELMAEEKSTEREEGTKTGEGPVGEGVRKGRVVSIHGDDIFVDVGGRSEALLTTQQFGPDDTLPNVGDMIEVVIAGFDASLGVLRLTREGAVEKASWDSLEKGQIVEGMVTGSNTGGLELTINSIRAFMPISQIDLARIEDTGPFLNTKMTCEVMEVTPSDRNLIVSRRALMKREADVQGDKTLESLHEGQVVEGTVRNIMPYGAFVDIGGVDGLLHVRDMSHSRTEKPEDVVHVGQKLELRVLSYDAESKKIGLGLKQTQSDPWDGVEGKFPVGSSVTGRIVKLMDFGAFLELEPGLEGLIPIGEISFRRIGHPREVLKEGDTIRVKVLRVEPDRQRMSLSVKAAGDDPWQGASARWPVGGEVSGVVTRIMDFGAFVELAEGVEGLVHISQLSDNRVETVKSVVSEGMTCSSSVD